MSNDSGFGVPAGWYPDPLGLPQMRWWDNHGWTEHTTEARAPIVIQEAKLAWADDELPTRRERRERERDDDGATPPKAPTAETLLQLEPPSWDALPANEPAPAALRNQEPAAAKDPFDEFISGNDFGADAKRAAATSTDSTVPGAFDAAASGFDANSAFEANSGFGASTGFSPSSSSQAATSSTFDASTSAVADGSASSGFAPQASAAASSSTGYMPEHDFAQFRATAYQPSFATQTATAVADAPKATGTRAAAAAARDANLSPHSPGAWIIALIPLLQLVATLLVVSTAGAIGSTVEVMAAIWLAPYFLVIPLAFFDRRALLKSGYEQPATWLWSLLGAPVYLIARAISIVMRAGNGFGPILVWGALALLQVGSIVAVPGLIISALPAVFTAEAEESIAHDATVFGPLVTVKCPSPPATVIGQQFTCKLTRLGAGAAVDVTASLQRANGWIAWRVDDWGVNTLER